MLFDRLFSTHVNLPKTVVEGAFLMTLSAPGASLREYRACYTIDRVSTDEGAIQSILRSWDDQGFWNNVMRGITSEGEHVFAFRAPCQLDAGWEVSLHKGQRGAWRQFARIRWGFDPSHALVEHNAVSTAYRVANATVQLVAQWNE